MNESNEQKNPQLLAGAAKVDITPDFGTQIAGDIGRYRPVEEIRDRLYARIIALKSGDQTACLVLCDMAAISIARPLREKIADILGTAPANVMVHSVQSHSACRIGKMFEDVNQVLPPELSWVHGETPAYNELFTKRVLEGVQTAKHMVPARLKAARAIDNRCAFNRRFVMRNGSAKTHPKNCDPNILYCEGPIDPEASFLCFEDLNAKPIAGLLHYTCHPVHGYPHRYISADWPGLWSEALSKKLGQDCVVGCLNGACGNISPCDHANPDYNYSTSLNRMLEHLTQTGEKLIAGLASIDALPLSTASRVIKIPWRQPPSEEADKARQMIKDHPTPIYLDEKKESISWDWVFALRTLDMMHRFKINPDYEFEIQVFRLGDALMVGWPGEPFVEAQLEVKLNSPAKYTLVGHECNDDGHCGYLPTLKAIERGGYETWGKLPPGTLEKITKRTIEIVKDMWQKKTI
jgi:hypothetical protein